MKTTIFGIYFFAGLIFAGQCFALWGGIENGNDSVLLPLALVFIAGALQEISKRLEKIEEVNSKQNEQPPTDQ